MLKQKNLKIIGFVLSLFWLVNTSYAGGLSKADSPVKPRTGAKRLTKFSSVYTDTTKDCEGEEPVFTCKGYGGYKVVIDIGGVFSDARIEAEKSEYSLDIAGRQSIGWNPKIEWRMADKKPFAVIVRVDINDENEEIPKKIGELLIIKGLQGFENIDEEIDAKTPKANEKAREIADKGYAGDESAEKNAKLTGEAYTDGEAALLSGEQIANLKKLNAAVALPTYIPAGYKLKDVWIQEPEAHIIAFSLTYENADGDSFQIQSNNEALGDMAVRREVKGKSAYFVDTARETGEFYAGRDENDAETVASEWLCSAEKYQPKSSQIQQCFQFLSEGKSISPGEAMKIMQSLRYLKR